MTTSDDPAVHECIAWVRNVMERNGLPGAAIAETRFRIGASHMGAVLAMAVADATDEGKLDLDASVARTSTP